MASSADDLKQNKLQNKNWHYQRRLFKNQILGHLIRWGGVSVIIVIILMFVYFISIALPLFKSPHIEKTSTFKLDSKHKTLLLSIDEQIEIGMRLTDNSSLNFFSLLNNKSIETHNLIENETQISSYSFLSGEKDKIILGYNDGHIQLIKHEYKLLYIEEKRQIVPELNYPYEPEQLSIENTKSIQLINASESEEQLLVATYNGNEFSLEAFTKEISLIDDAVRLENQSYKIISTIHDPEYLLIDTAQQWLYIANKKGYLEVISIVDIDNINTLEKIKLTENDASLDELVLLTGGISLIAADSAGQISQWTPVRNQNSEYKFTRIRQLDTKGSSINFILPETLNKGFTSIQDNNQLHLFHTTAERHLLSEQVSSANITHAATSPRSNAILFEDSEKNLSLWKIDNKHPEVSFKTLWQKVWYENHNKPKYLWQSSSAANDFEPKLSLIPLTFGTFKAAFYAMLIATPLALMGAIYTAYFMSSRVRGIVKPTIEIMEALPTVILGFLAGLWLAPIAENQLASILATIILLPISVFIFGFLWQKLPHSIQSKVPSDWQPFLLLPVITILTLICFNLTPLIEQWLLGTQLRHWLTQEGFDFDQRNALIVGIAMGFAVIPTIFSITEDAIYSVPRSIINGSLAVGATPWQTMLNIILPTASPAIFSAIMIGFGRAIGETMIVLMATGNTPIIDMNIFEGMRTLSANLAVELPESEVGGTHFRVLFLSALILFAFTFILNTVAETVRQSLRQRYSKL